jgi:hypothetical protein
MADRFKRGMRILFRIGPILLLAPLVLWAWVWTNILTGEATDAELRYIVPPIRGFLFLAVLWHVSLVVVEKGRRIPYLVYAILHMPAFYFVYLFALIFATHFPV